MRPVPGTVTERPSPVPELLREVEAATNAYNIAGYQVDAYSMALAHVCGKHGLEPSYAAKLDELNWRAVTAREEQRTADESEPGLPGNDDDRHDLS